MAEKSGSAFPHFDSIDDVAKHCLDSFPATTEARQAMVAFVSEDQELRDLLVTTKELERMCGERLYRMMLKERRVIWASHFNSPNPDANTKDGGLGRTSMRMLYDYPLFDGSRLGDADKGKVGQQAEISEVHARSNAAKARWFRLIEAGLKGKKVVRDQLSKERLEKMKNEASDGV